MIADIAGAVVLAFLAAASRGATQGIDQGTVSGTAPVNGTRLAYEVRGEGKTIVLIHGGLVDRRMWDDQFEVFSRTYRVVRYDIRGYADSDKASAPFSPVEDLRRLLEFLGIPKAVVIGLSLGGQIAIDFALEHPDMVEALIPVSSAVSGFPFKIPADLEAGYEAVFKADKERGRDAAVEALLKLSFFIPYKPDDEIRRRMIPMLRRNFEAWTAAGTGGTYIWPEPLAYGRIERIAMPTLVIVGDKDTPPILDAGEDLARRIKGARKVVIPEAGHHLNMEQPAAFNKAVLEFLAGLEKGI